jgi:hypothetical protein
MKRLNHQIAYFARAGRERGWQYYTQHLPALCFFVSVLLALAHFALAIYEQEGVHELSPSQIEAQGAVMVRVPANTQPKPRATALSVSYSSC